MRSAGVYGRLHHAVKRYRPKRVYDAANPDDGLRVLVDRLWPRGLSKAEARVDLWLKEASPSNELRRAFHAGEMSWEDFAEAYVRELSREPANSAARALAKRNESVVTLLYSSKNTKQNNAAVLAAWLERESRSQGRG
ncbi:MAG: DUF488 domain-containing protein [Hyphomicrobiales bacterium]